MVGVLGGIRAGRQVLVGFVASAGRVITGFLLGGVTVDAGTVTR
jgi:hypothetical protein